MGDVDVGVAVFQTDPVRDIIALTRAAEESGYSDAWVGDSQMIWRETYVTLGALAVSTSRIHLGTSVTNPVTRHPVVTASAFTSLQELSRGRAVLGIGLGDSSLETLGKTPAKMAELRDAIALIRALMHGETVRLDDEDIRLSYIAGEFPPPPVFVGATGPKMLQLAGEVADGVILMCGADRNLIETGLGEVGAGARQAGRDAAELKTAAWIPMSIDSDAQVAKDNVRAHVARWALRQQAFPFEPHIQDALEEIRRAYDYYGHLRPGSAQSRLVSDELVEICAIAGTPDECGSKIQELFDSGVSQLALVPHGAGRETQIRRFAKEVLGR